MKDKNHIHKFKKHSYKTGSSVFHCTLPDCYFKVSVELALGKRSLCNVCNEPFILNSYSIQLVKPRCDNCHRRKNAIVLSTKDTNPAATGIGTVALPKISQSIANETVNSLRNRLETSQDNVLVKEFIPEDEEDEL